MTHNNTTFGLSRQQEQQQKPALGSSKATGGEANGWRGPNVPSDMVDTPPIPCAFAVGDNVVFTNCNGVRFDLTVRGFASEPHTEGDDPRFIYVFTDAWWFPVAPSTLRARAQGGA